jgi:signal peptidase II
VTIATRSTGARARARVLAFALAVVALDQVTKAIAVARLSPGRSVHALDGILYWTLQRNPGAAFSLFTRFPVVFTVLAFVISIVIVARAHRVSGRMNTVAMGLILGGAVGNLVDRIARPPGAFRGHVIDFIDFRVWPVFNLADSAIVVGALLLVLASFRAERAARRAR